MTSSAGSTDPAADLLQTVVEAYGLPGHASAERLTGGYANDVFLLKGERSVVLHVKHPPLDLQSLSWEHQLLNLLGPRLPEVPAPLPDWLVWDLASSIGPFCNTPDGDLDVNAMQEFLDSYRGARGRVPPEEDDLIVSLLRVKRILEVLRAPTDRHPRWDYQLANLRAYQHLL